MKESKKRRKLKSLFYALAAKEKLTVKELQMLQDLRVALKMEPAERKISKEERMRRVELSKKIIQDMGLEYNG